LYTFEKALPIINKPGKTSGPFENVQPEINITGKTSVLFNRKSYGSWHPKTNI
jgi:hypothetical protein